LDFSTSNNFSISASTDGGFNSNNNLGGILWSTRNIQRNRNCLRRGGGGSGGRFAGVGEKGQGADESWRRGQKIG
jgi:hypothetical protein